MLHTSPLSVHFELLEFLYESFDPLFKTKCSWNVKLDKRHFTTSHVYRFSIRPSKKFTCFSVYLGLLPAGSVCILLFYLQDRRQKNSDERGEGSGHGPG